MNLLQLITECEARTGFNSTDYRVQWTAFLNDGVREFARRYPWPGLEDLIQCSSDGTRFLILPGYVDTVISILNRTDSIAVPRGGDFDRQATFVTAQRTTGPVVNYDKIGIVPVLRDPVGLISLRGTSSSDTGAPAVYITGYANNSGATATGMERTIQTVSVTPLGLSSVTVTQQFAAITSISKVTDSNGDFFFHDLGDSLKHISFLGRYEPEASFKRVQLLFSPSAQTTFEVKFRHKVIPLRQPEQAPHPAVDGDFVITHALALFYRQQQQFSKAQLQDNRALDILQQRAHKEQNFDEPWQQITPVVEPRPSSYGSGGYGYWQ